MKKEIKLTPKDALKAAITAQWEEQQKLSQELNEKLLNSLTIKDLKKIHTMNEMALQFVKNADIKEIKNFIQLGLNFMDLK